MCEVGERLGEVEQLLPGLITLSGLCFRRGEPTRGLEFARRALELAGVRQDQALLAGVYQTAGVLAYSCGRLREAAMRLENATTHAARTERIVSMTGMLYPSCVACFHALPLHLLGRVAEALTLADKGVAKAQESGHPFTLGFALLLRSGLSRYRREMQVVLTLSERVIELAEKSGFAAWRIQGRFNRGLALTELGQLKEGIKEMEWAIDSDRQMGGTSWLQYLIALLAQAYARDGKSKEGLSNLNESLEHVVNTGETVDYAEMLRLKGALLLLHDPGAMVAAERCFRAGLKVARAQEARWWELRTAVTYAGMLRDTPRRGQAHTMLAQIYDRFTEGFDTADLKEAKLLLDDLRR
jgi:predicted ATPase